MLTSAGLPVDPKAIGVSCPSQQFIQDAVLDGAVDCLLWLRDMISKAKAIFLSCDKGHRKGVDHFAKILSWWNAEEK